jgi:hypothetical protein
MHTHKVLRQRVVLILSLAAAGMIFASCSIQKPTDSEKAVLVGAGDFVKYGFALGPSYGKYERYMKISFSSGNFLLQYIYQPPAEEEGSIKYITETLRVQDKPLRTAGNDAMMESTVKTVFSAQKITLREEKMTFRYGARNKLFTIINEAGDSAGSYISIGDDRLECTFMIIGVLVDREDVLEELFRDKLDAAKELGRGQGDPGNK